MVQSVNGRLMAVGHRSCAASENENPARDGPGRGCVGGARVAARKV